MGKVFGLPATELAIGMTVLLVVIFSIIAIGAARRFILVKMGGIREAMIYSPINLRRILLLRFPVSSVFH